MKSMRKNDSRTKFYYRVKVTKVKETQCFLPLRSILFLDQKKSRAYIYTEEAKLSQKFSSFSHLQLLIIVEQMRYLALLLPF